MTPSTILRIKEAVSLPGMIGEYVKLRPLGKEFIGLCCFHEEKTPSFRVHPTYYKCFGCGVSGDCIDFYAAIHSVSKGAAIKALADAYGISLDGPRVTRIQRVYDAQEREFAEWWQKRTAERLAKRLTAYVSMGTEEEADAAGLLWRQVAGVKGDERLRLCLSAATAEERGEWRAELEFKERWLAIARMEGG